MAQTKRPTYKFSQTIGNGQDTEFKIVHDLQTQDLIVQVYRSEKSEIVMTDIRDVTSTSLIVGFAIAPQVDEFRVVVVG
jgi:hypothetical protein